MDDTTTSTQSAQEQVVTHVPDPTIGREAEHRESYGTAKTEDLRDSGIWRTLLPAFVIACCLLLIAIPLVILVPLLGTALDPASAARSAGFNFMWIWITLIVIALGTATVVVRGLYKIFLTQAGNYPRL